jgi:hypothetical protein
VKKIIFFHIIASPTKNPLLKMNTSLFLNVPYMNSQEYHYLLFAPMASSLNKDDLFFYISNAEGADPS